MKLKRMVTRLVASILVFAFSSTTAFAGLNLGNDDGTNFKGGTSNNYWGVYTDGGVPLNDTEGLRVTIYDAKTNAKVFNTISRLRKNMRYPILPSRPHISPLKERDIFTFRQKAAL